MVPDLDQGLFFRGFFFGGGGSFQKIILAQ